MNQQKNITPYDKSEIFETQIQPLVKKILNVCSINDIPMFFACCPSNDENVSQYIKECVSPQSHNISLSQDYFSNLIAVTLGFNTVPPIERPNISYDET